MPASSRASFSRLPNNDLGIDLTISAILVDNQTQNSTNNVDLLSEEDMSEEQRRQLQQQLWNIANTLRGKMGADEFRDYILGFIFYKYLSEKIQRFADAELAQENLKFAEINEATSQGQAYIEALEDAALDELGYFLKPSELFHAIAMRGSNQLDTNGVGDSHNFILGDLTKILKNIEQSTLGTDSADDFANLFEDLDLTSGKLGKTEKEKNDLVAKVLVHLDKIDFNLSDATADVLGDAYEYLIGEFASGAGKKAGEFYTPQPVSTLLAKLVTANNKSLKSVYDPTCGSGSLLLRVKREASHVDKIYGQEMNRTTYNLARMNMILHDVHYADFDIKQEDTLERPQHRDLRFDAIVANPPFSAQWKADPLYMNDDRFSVYGKLAPSSKADMAFVQHMVYHLAEEGTMAVVLPHGVLFRGAAEGHIRQYLIEQLNCLDAVIGLPANIFYGTSIPTCVLVFKKCRKNSDNIFFIDASQHFEKVKTTNVMRPEHIQKIADTYKIRTNEEKYSHVATIESIKANDYNLNIPRYVDTFEAEDVIDLAAISAQLIELDKASQATDETIAAFCKELGIEPPFAVQVQQA
jgi:type I restriction enzyme M protein